MRSRSNFRSNGKPTRVPKPIVTHREQPPRVRQTDHGIQLLCPFCVPAHTIVPGQVAPCGTVLKLTAVQTIIPARTVRDKNLTCIKCGESGKGVMTPYKGQYVHLEDCKPGTMLLAEPPKFSKKAEQVYAMKDGWLKRWMIKRNGNPEQVQEIDPDGVKTGKILGYVFVKE